MIRPSRARTPGGWGARLRPSLLRVPAWTGPRPSKDTTTPVVLDALSSPGRPPCTESTSGTSRAASPAEAATWCQRGVVRSSGLRMRSWSMIGAVQTSRGPSLRCSSALRGGRGERPPGRAVALPPRLEQEEELGIRAVGIGEDRPVEQPGGRVGVAIDRVGEQPQRSSPPVPELARRSAWPGPSSAGADRPRPRRGRGPR